MSKIENFGKTQTVEITVLVDNRADLSPRSTDTVKRYTKEPLLAEHGFSALVDLKDAGIKILWDAGISQVALMENVRRMKIDLATIDKIALSHGHHDHYAAMADVIKEITERPEHQEWGEEVTAEEVERWVQSFRVPMIVHPAVFRERWGIDDEQGKKYGPYLAPRTEWEAAGANIVLSEGPYQLSPGCWTTGAVPRLSFETAGTPAHIAYREEGGFIRDYIDDDQSLVIDVEDKGLVILTGCAHSGIVNTVNYAKEISGVEQVWAILGGFHLGRAKDEQIQRAIDEIKNARPKLIAPSHCTGFTAISQFAHQMPDEFVLGVVGTKYLF